MMKMMKRFLNKYIAYANELITSWHRRFFVLSFPLRCLYFSFILVLFLVHSGSSPESHLLKKKNRTKNLFISEKTS